MIAVSSRARLSGAWFDAVLATALLIACEIEVITDVVSDRGHDHWPLAADIVVVMAVTIPLAWRRLWPLASMIAVKVGVLVLATSLADVATVNFPQLVLFIAPYSVAAYSPRSRALIGLAVGVAADVAVNLHNPSGAASWVFSIGVCMASWATGRVMRQHRALAVELKQLTARIAAERSGRELLAIAEQRTRIASELQTLVAGSVSAMIVQTQAARRLLVHSPDAADAAMATIEDTGRQALAEMRRILGVLRHGQGQPDLAPQPGIGQIPALLEQARCRHPHVALSVQGEPGPLPASVDLGLYRILEEALGGIDDTTTPVDISLRFGSEEVELGVAFGRPARLDWPSIALRERVALCQGVLDVDTLAGSGERLTVRLPQGFGGVLV